MRQIFLSISLLLLLPAYILGQIAPSLTVPRGHKDMVRNCYFTPTDRYLISTDYDHVLCIWDGDDGRQVFTLRDSTASFSKIEVNNSSTLITALTDSGKLYIIDFITLKIKKTEDSVVDYSLHRKEEVIFFAHRSGSIYKYTPKNNLVKKIRYAPNLQPEKLVTLSQTEICIQDNTKGIFIINETSGKVEQVRAATATSLKLHDYHSASGNLLCSYFDSYNNKVAIFNIDARTRSVKGKISLDRQYRGPDCLYTADATRIVATNVSGDPDGYLTMAPPVIYSFNTARIDTINSENTFQLNELNINYSGKNAVIKNSNDSDVIFGKYDFRHNTIDFVSRQNITQDDPKFACANNSTKIAVFQKGILLPAIYPEGRIDPNKLTEIKKYNDLKINFWTTSSKAGNSSTEKKFDFLLANQTGLNDSTILSSRDSLDENSGFYTCSIGTIYKVQNGYTKDSIKFLFQHMARPYFNSGQLFWSLNNNFFILDIANLKISDSISFPPDSRIDHLQQRGTNVLINKSPGSYSCKYDIIQKKITDTAFIDMSSFIKPLDEINYSHRTEGMPSENAVKDYDYIQNTIFEYPFFYGRVDTVAVFDSVGEISSYQAVQAVPYVTVISNPDSPDAKQMDISAKIENMPVQQVRHWYNGFYVIMTKSNSLFLYSLLQDSVLKKINCITNQYSKLFIWEKNKNIIVSDENRNDVYIIDIVAGKIISHLKGFFNPLINQTDGLLLLQDAAFENYYVYTEKDYHYISSITPFSKTEYVVNTPNGLFDGTDKAVENLYFLINDATDKNKPWKTIDLTQLKAKYYIPGLWDKLMAGDSTDLPDVESIKNLSLAPEIITDSSYSFTKPYKITLLDKGGGIGAVRIVINGKEVIADARKNKTAARKKLTLAIDLQPYKKYFSPDNNTIQVFSSNTDSSLTSRGLIVASSGKSGKQANPKLFVISIGTSDYKGTEIDLQYSSKDALDIATALKAGSQKLFGADSTFVYTLTSNATDSTRLPSKKNIVRVFTEVSKLAAAKDIVVLYLSGHGINTSGSQGDFYYLTKEAYTANASAYTFKEVLKFVGISSNEFTEYLKNVAARKQLFIIDACASGKMVENLIAHRDIPYSTLKALDRLKDRTGTHIITGCAADAVSYEASRFGQGILTYSLLEGMKGASLRDNKFLDVAQWFQYARERVPQLAIGLGGIQTPQVYSPSGNESFDIAELDEDEKKQVPLAQQKPVFIKSIFQEEEKFFDILSVGRFLDSKLYETSSNNKNNNFIFFPVDEFANAYQVLGRYKVSNNQILAVIKITNPSTQEIVSSFSVSVPDTLLLSAAIIEKIRELK
ncbi:MAG: caspase family protein [Chitinophagaceae bacterium]